MRSPSRCCTGSSAGRKRPRGVFVVPDPLPEVAHRVVDPPQVVVRRGVEGAEPEPARVVLLHRLEVEVGQPPVLPGVGELVGRNPEPRVPAQVVRVGPGVGAVLADDERLVAGEQDPVLPGDGPDRVPLLLGHELEPGMEADTVGEAVGRRGRAPRAVARGRPAATPTTAAAPGPRPWPRRASSCPATPRSAVGRPRSGRRDRSPASRSGRRQSRARPTSPGSPKGTSPGARLAPPRAATAPRR